MTADLLARLIDAGTPSVLVAEVALALGRAAGDQEALSVRRERDAARQREKRDRSKVSRDITVRHGTSVDVADEIPSPDKSPPHPQKLTPTPGVCVAHTREVDPVEPIVAAWNAMAKRVGLPVVTKMTAIRRRNVRARLADHTFADFTEAIAAVERSSFCRGASEGGWRANFDFLIQHSSFTKLLEGAYDRSSSSNGSPRPSGRPSGWAPAPGFNGFEPASLDD